MIFQSLKILEKAMLRINFNWIFKVIFFIIYINPIHYIFYLFYSKNLKGAGAESFFAAPFVVRSRVTPFRAVLEPSSLEPESLLFFVGAGATHLFPGARSDGLFFKGEKVPFVFCCWSWSHAFYYCIRSTLLFN